MSKKVDFLPHGIYKIVVDPGANVCALVGCTEHLYDLPRPEDFSDNTIDHLLTLNYLVLNFGYQSFNSIFIYTVKLDKNFMRMNYYLIYFEMYSNDQIYLYLLLLKNIMLNSNFDY